jgi:hypothetical protein
MRYVIYAGIYNLILIDCLITTIEEYNKMLTVLSNENPWLLRFHCFPVKNQDLRLYQHPARV